MKPTQTAGGVATEPCRPNIGCPPDNLYTDSAPAGPPENRYWGGNPNSADWTARVM
jgi:hypothetical protein